MFLSYEESIFRMQVCTFLLRFAGCEGLSNSVLSQQTVLLTVFITGSDIQSLRFVGRVEVTINKLTLVFWLKYILMLNYLGFVVSLMEQVVFI